MEHTDAAQVAALLGAVGAVLVLVSRNRFAALAGFALLGLAAAGLIRSLVGDDDLELLLTEPAGLALLATGAGAVVLGAVPLVRYPAVVPVALLAAAPFRIPVELGEQEAFLLLPFYLVLTASELALGYRLLRGEQPPALPFVLALPIAAFVAFTSLSYVWTWDEREGAVALAFFVFPFTAALGIVVRAPRASWLPRALLATLVGLGVVFASIGIWQAQTRTLFFARDVEVANAYTSFFRVTSVFKDPSLYGRYLVVPIAVLLVVILLRRGRTIDWVAAAAVGAFLFWGLFYSYSQSSFVALFVVAFAVALVAFGKRMRIVLLACALAAVLAAAALAADAVNGRSARDVTSGRSRLISVTLDAFQASPVSGVGVGGQPRASAEESGKGSSRRHASHTTALTVLAELGLVGFVLYGWVLAVTGWALYVVSRRDLTLGAALGAVFLVLVVHSTLYAGFFEDPLTWGVFGLAGTALAAFAAPSGAGVAKEAPRVFPAKARFSGLTLMPRALRWIIAAVAVLLVSVVGVAVALWLSQDRPSGALDTELTDVTTSTATTTKPEKPPPPKPTSDRLCWLTFGGDPQRSLARPGAKLGLPAREVLWSRGLKNYIEFPPTYCQGRLYVNTYKGDTFALDAETGRVLWKRRGNQKPSTPAIDGPRLIVSSKDGSVSALSRRSGRTLWRVQTAGKVESSPIVVDGLVYFGSTDHRLYAVRSKSGRIKWAYNTGGRINASPSVFGNRVCISTYAGSVVCVRKDTGREIWTTYVRRDTFRDESFYASPSTDGERIYSVSRSGTVVALDFRDGDVVWTGRVGGLGYTTPAVADGRVYVGGFDGKLRALRARDGNEIWQTEVPGRILGAPVVIGDHVFFSTLERRTYALRLSDGKIVWKLRMGRYSPGIATERTYYFSLNGRLVAFRGRNTPSR